MTKFRLSNYKGQQVGKVVLVYSEKYVIYTAGEGSRESDGTTIHVGMHPSKVVSTRLTLYKNSKKILEGKPSLNSRKGEGQTQGRNDREDAGEEVSHRQLLLKMLT
ncbi:60S ribosomal protein L26-like 1 [Lemmus lemmus]